MTDTVYLYPKSSCSLSECKREYPVVGLGVPGMKTNLGIETCQLSPYFDCYYSAEISRKIEPTSKVGWTELNPQAYLDKMSKDFNQLPSGQCGISPGARSPGIPKGCNDPSYISMDPRLFSSTRADYLILDRPPINGKTRLKNIYNPSLKGYGDETTSYSGIRDGQIVYYTDKSISPAFYSPVFAEKAKEVISIYKDPMGAIKTVADRIPLTNTMNPTTITRTDYPYCLSSIQDTQSFREDLMALQQRKNNQEKWTVRWGAE